MSKQLGKNFFLHPHEKVDLQNFVTWFAIFALLIGALFGEWKATTDLTKESKDTKTECSNESTTPCDTILQAATLLRSQNVKMQVKWRRGFIGACAICFLIKPLLGIHLFTRQAIWIIAICWIVIIALDGYNDYHMRQVAEESIQSCLSVAVSTTAIENTVCDPSLRSVNIKK